MHISRKNWYWVVAVAAAVVGGGAYVSKDLWKQRPGAGSSANGHVPGAAGNHSDAAASPVEVAGSTAIEFPKEMWESAKLQVQPARQALLTEVIKLTGKIALNEDRLSHVFPLVEGRVDEVKVLFGQKVKKGELLVVVQSKEVGQGMLQLYQDRQRLEFAEAKNRWTQDVGQNTQSMIGMMRKGASVESLEQTFGELTLGDHREKLMTAYVSHRKARANLDRLSPLMNTGAVPSRQIMEAEAEVDAARATLQALWEQISQDTVQASRLSAQAIKDLQTNIAITETNLKILGFKEDELQHIDPSMKGEELAHYPVMAPFDGTVISKDVVLLERVGPERQILTIADLSTVWVSADIYETQLPLLAQLKDQKLKIKCEAWPDREFEAQIFYTGDVVQEATRTIALRAAADNPEGLLKPGMFVSVLLPNPQARDVVQVPAHAIQDHEGVSFVFVQTGDQEFLRRDVTLGTRSEDVVEVRDGVKAGDRVVVEGGFALKSKMLADLLAE